MDYQHYIKSLVKEAKEGIQYKKMPLGLRILTIIAMAPFVAAVIACIIFWNVILFMFYAISSPVDYLEGWQTGKKDTVHVPTQAVFYLVTTPIILIGKVFLSLAGFFFYFTWFFMMVFTYLLTLGGVRWQPYLNTATYDDTEYKWSLRPGKIPAMVYSIVSVSLLFFVLLFFLIALIEPDVTIVYVVFLVLYLIPTAIVNPIMFKKKNIAAKETPEVAAEQ